MPTIQEQAGALEQLAQNAPGAGIATLKQDIDDYIQKVAGVTGEIAGVPELRATGEHAKQALETAAAALAQLPLDVSAILSRVIGGA